MAKKKMLKNQQLKDKLKPYIHKIKGAKHVAFFDMLNGDFYHFKPAPGDGIQEVRRQLKDAGLIFETDAVVPNKTTLNVLGKADDIVLRKLQIRISGHCEDTCWNRAKTGKPKEPMSLDIAGKIAEFFQDVPIHQVTIEAAALDEKTITTLLKDLHFEALQIRLENRCDPKAMDSLNSFLAEKEARPVVADIKRKIPIEEINTTAYDFFYSQTFNPCLGHQAAIDTQGEIKPCLWWKDSMGNIMDNSFRNMVFQGKFAPFWEAGKWKIDGCKDCEYRYNCNDCRIQDKIHDKTHKKNPTAHPLPKPHFCRYNPYLGEGSK